jgi:hypothetical protein
MKDENKGKGMEEFVGLKSKMYAYDVDGKEHKKSKSIKKNIVKSTITLEDYRTCLFQKEEKYRRMNLIRSYKHETYTVQINKKH